MQCPPFFSLGPKYVSCREILPKTVLNNQCTILGPSLTVDIKPKGVWSNDIAVVLDDPFDAEWAALATRENVSPATGLDKSYPLTIESPSSTNPFTNTPSQLQNASSGVKAFELQM